MEFNKLIERFGVAAPIALMTRVLAQGFAGSSLDGVFEANRNSQYPFNAKFSAIALAVADVALCCSENFNQSYKKHKENLGISLQSFYSKINGTETSVSEATVSSSAAKAIALQDELNFRPWEIIRGYRFLAVDGNVLAKTDKRLGVLRESKGAPMPGKVVARFDLQRQIFDRAYLIEDGHAQETGMCDRVASDLSPDDVIVADRMYCIISFFESIAGSKAHFIIRQHGRLHGILIGKRKRIGRCSTGMVYEQALKVSKAEDSMIVRRITIERDEPTRDGEMEVHLLSSLPLEIDALQIANIYRLRWDEENAFHVLQMTFTCELATVGHPRAALFLFSMAMLAFNLRQVILASLYAEHSEKDVSEVSNFHLSKEVSDTTIGMLIVIPEEAWIAFTPKTNSSVAKLLRRISSKINLANYRKSKRGPRK